MHNNNTTLDLNTSSISPNNPDFTLESKINSILNEMRVNLQNSSGDKQSIIISGVFGVFMGIPLTLQFVPMAAGAILKTATGVAVTFGVFFAGLPIIKSTVDQIILALNKGNFVEVQAKFNELAQKLTTVIAGAIIEEKGKETPNLERIANLEASYKAVVEAANMVSSGQPSKINFPGLKDSILALSVLVVNELNEPQKGMLKNLQDSYVLGKDNRSYLSAVQVSRSEDGQVLTQRRKAPVAIDTSVRL
jgi:hypothetical protein